jgi:hypothetical protein
MAEEAGAYITYFIKIAPTRTCVCARCVFKRKIMLLPAWYRYIGPDLSEDLLASFLLQKRKSVKTLLLMENFNELDHTTLLDMLAEYTTRYSKMAITGTHSEEFKRQQATLQKLITEIKSREKGDLCRNDVPGNVAS